MTDSMDDLIKSNENFSINYIHIRKGLNIPITTWYILTDEEKGSILLKVFETEQQLIYNGLDITNYWDLLAHEVSEDKIYSLVGSVMHILNSEQRQTILNRVKNVALYTDKRIKDVC